MVGGQPSWGGSASGAWVVGGVGGGWWVVRVGGEWLVGLVGTIIIFDSETINCFGWVLRARARAHAAPRHRTVGYTPGTDYGKRG